MTIAGIDMQVQNAQGSSSNGQAKRGMVLPFQPLSLAFNHVNYYVDMPLVSHFFSFSCTDFKSVLYLSTEKLTELQIHV